MTVRGGEVWRGEPLRVGQQITYERGPRMVRGTVVETPRVPGLCRPVAVLLDTGELERLVLLPGLRTVEPRSLAARIAAGEQIKTAALAARIDFGDRLPVTLQAAALAAALLAWGEDEVLGAEPSAPAEKEGEAT